MREEKIDGYFAAILTEHQGGEMRSFELDRFRSFRVLDKSFERDESRFDMFDKSFGIWDDENLPVEHIVLRVSSQE